METVKKLEPWSRLDKLSFLMVNSGDCVFSLEDEVGIMKFWLFKLHLTLKVKVNPSPKP